ncbi:hypothetical protein HYV83_05220 [Candidatus Woesearchaeota archaeon]|nr:hypothetical protein [Candidatus Woesearchaeota archaeon]
MEQAGIKKLFVLVAFVIVGVSVLYLFTLFGGKEKPADETEQVQIVQVSEAEAQPPVQQAQAVNEFDEFAKFYPPDEVLASLCSQYSNLPVDVVPCRNAYDFVIKNYKASIVSFSLLLQASNGRLQPLAAGQPATAAAGTPQGARLVWYAVLEEKPAFSALGSNETFARKAVIIDAKNLSVVKETS